MRFLRARYGVGDDPCVKKQDCQICKVFTPSQILQLATPTYKARKERGEQKKSAERTQQAVEELEYLVTFNRSILQAMQRTMQDLSEGVFISMANLTLACQDSYLEFLHGGVKPDTLTALRTAPVHLNSLFPDSLLVKAEDEISGSEERRSGSSNRKPGRFHPYVSSNGRSTQQPDRKPTTPAWKQIRDRQIVQKGHGKASNFTQKPAKGFKKHNDNYCVLNVAGVKNSVHVSGKKKDLNPSLVTSKSETVFLHVNSFVANVHSVTGLPQKKGVNPNYCYNHTEIKHVNNVSCVGHLSSANTATNVPTIVINPPVGARLQQFWEQWEALGSSPKVVTILKGLHPSLPVQTQSNQVTNCHKQLCQPTKTVPPSGGTVSADKQKCSRTGSKPKLTGFLQPAIFGTQNQQPVETHPGPEHSEHLPKHRVVQNGDPRDNKDLPSDRGVGHFHRLQGRILPHTNSQSVQEVHAFLHPGSVLPVQSPTLLSVHTTYAVHSGGQRGQTDGVTEGYKNPPVPRRLVGERHVPPNMSAAYTDLGSSLSITRVAGEQGEVRTGPKTGLQLRRLPVRPQGGQGQTHTRTLADLNRQDIVNPVRSGGPVRQFMSLIGLLTATEKQLHLGRLHMRPIQWHLKNNWRVPESLEKVIPVPRSLHPHLKWWLEESNVLPGQPLHPLKHALQIFTDTSKEGWGAHLNERTARGTWSVPESKLHINHLAVLKEFQDLCSNNIVLVATDNTTVVAYINKEAGMKSGYLCPLLWRILSWCTRKKVTLKARHILGRLNMIADKLSRLDQTIQTEWSLHPEVFKAICSWWHQPQVDLFATRFNNKLPQFVSPVLDAQAWAVDALSLSWENLDPNAFPQAAILGKVVEKLQDYPCNRIILIAPEWPNMPQFWDLVAMSSQIPLCLPNLPNLVSQPFN